MRGLGTSIFWVFLSAPVCAEISLSPPENPLGVEWDFGAGFHSPRSSNSFGSWQYNWGVDRSIESKRRWPVPESPFDPSLYSLGLDLNLTDISSLSQPTYSYFPNQLSEAGVFWLGDTGVGIDFLGKGLVVRDVEWWAVRLETPDIDVEANIASKFVLNLADSSQFTIDLMALTLVRPAGHTPLETLALARDVYGAASDADDGRLPLLLPSTAFAALQKATYDATQYWSLSPNVQQLVDQWLISNIAGARGALAVPVGP